MAAPTRYNSDIETYPSTATVVFEVVSINAGGDPLLEFLPEEPIGALLKTSIFVVQPLSGLSEAAEEQRRRHEDVFADAKPLPSTLRPRAPHFFTHRCFQWRFAPGTAFLAMHRHATVTMLLLHRCIAAARLACQGMLGAIRLLRDRTYVAARVATVDIAVFTWRSVERVVELAISAGTFATSQQSIIDLRRRAGAFRDCFEAAAMLVPAKTRRIPTAIQRLKSTVACHVFLVTRTLLKWGNAAFRKLVCNVQTMATAPPARIPFSPCLLTQIRWSALRIGRFRIPATNRTLAVFSGGAAVGGLILWLIDAPIGAPSKGAASDGIRVAGLVALAPPGDQDTVHRSTPATTLTTAQDMAELRVPSSPVMFSTELNITSMPAGARVTVDGISWGDTPVTIRHLPPGRKVLRLTKQGYHTQQRVVSASHDRRTVAVRVTLPARR